MAINYSEKETSLYNRERKKWEMGNTGLKNELIWYDEMMKKFRQNPRVLALSRTQI